MKTLSIVTTLALLPALASTTLADKLPEPVEGMECVVGNWKGTGTLAMGADTAKISATWSCKRTSARWGVSCAFRITGIPGVPVYEETDLFGYDPSSNTYHWYAVTNAGETHDHVAPVTTSNTIQFVYTGKQEGKPFREVIDLTFAQDKKSIIGRSESFVDGKSTSVLQLKLTK